jgi:hypothetical protein
MKSIRLLAAACAAAIFGLRASAGIDVNNTAGTHSGNISRKAEADIGVANLMLKFGTDAASQVNLCGATDFPIGLAGDSRLTGQWVDVSRLQDGETKLGVASKAIAAGVPVFTASSGKLTDTAVNNCFRVGISLTAAGANNDEFEFLPETPAKQTVG